MDFRLVGAITDQETIAVGPNIRELRRLRRVYGKGRWRKRKGKALVQLSSGEARWAEVHWYEASGIGRRDLKIKRFLD
jgi:hypothetical protein